MAKKAGKVTKKRSSAKAVKAKSEVRVKPRRLKQSKYKTLKLHKRIKHSAKLPNVWQLTRQAALTLWGRKDLFIGITLIYGVLDLVLAQGVSGGTNVSTLKHSLSQASNGHFNGLASGVGVFALLIGSAGNKSSPAAGTYQLFLTVIVSLAIIWALRQVLAGAKLRIRDAFYRGMYPLVPFILVLLVVSLQLLPLLIGSLVYGLVTTNGIAAYFIEKLLWALLYILLALLSLYMISSSLFAVYIVTLPDMTPLKALRSARELVRHRRWTVLRKILWLPLFLLVVAAVIMVPIIIWLTPVAQWAFFALTMFSLIAVHSYMYTLYRELLNE